MRLSNLVSKSLLLVTLLLPLAAPTRAQMVDVIEYYNVSQDHYFISSLQADINALDSGQFKGWARTGLTFKVFAAAMGAASPVCRFYIPPAQGDSHFYSASPAECVQTATKFPTFIEESPNVMYVDLPDTTTGACPVGDLPVYRVWDNRVDSNHRYTTDLAIRAQMVAKGWIAEGYGPNLVIMCAPSGMKIASISVCVPGNGSNGSCPADSVDSIHPVLAPLAQGGGSINGYGGLIGVSDEHQTILPPGTVPGHGTDYLFLVSSQTSLTQAQGPGLVFLTGGAGPDGNGQWTLDFASDYGRYQPAHPASSQYGPVFTSSLGLNGCPITSSPALQDPTFDLTYAAPGSVVVDPTNPSNAGYGNLLMVYEGTNTCVGVTNQGGAGNFYSTVGIATSLDHGLHWPTYRADWVALPGVNPSQGPNAPFGALGAQVCIGNDCVTPPPANYGRYAVLSQPVTAAAAIADGKPLGSNMGNSTMSAFVDDINTSSGTYLYVASIFNAGPTDLGGFHFGPSAQTVGLAVARAALNGGSAPLQFMKWFGAAVSFANGTSSGSFALANPPTLPVGVTCGSPSCPPYPDNKGLGNAGGGLDSPIFPKDPNGTQNAASYKTCQIPAQNQIMPVISSVEATREYLLTFVCESPTDPATQAGPAGAAWFYSTLDATQYDLSRQDKWSAPKEIIGSWSSFDPNLTCSASGAYRYFPGWYPSFMSLSLKPGQLSTSGYVFFLNGCDAGGSGRQYASRRFSVTTK